VDHRTDQWHFKFDAVLHNATQDDVYEALCSSVVADACAGKTGAGRMGAGRAPASSAGTAKSCMTSRAETLMRGCRDAGVSMDMSVNISSASTLQLPSVSIKRTTANALSALSLLSSSTELML
jgi:hypothetical protein